jgi:hypothetical protein
MPVTSRRDIKVIYFVSDSTAPRCTASGGLSRLETADRRLVADDRGIPRGS